MKRFIILLAVTFFLSCNNHVEEKKITLDTSQLVQHQIDFLNASLWLSPSYDMITYDEMVEMLQTAPNQSFEFLLQASSSYKDKDEKPIFFQDDLATENIIVLLPMPYQPIDKQTVSLWISGMVSSMKNTDVQDGRASEIMEKRNKKFGNHQMVKFKAKQTDYLGNRRYFTQYYISGNLNSFMVIHLDIFNRDIETNLKMLSTASQ